MQTLRSGRTEAFCQLHGPVRPHRHVHGCHVVAAHRGKRIGRRRDACMKNVRIRMIERRGAGLLHCLLRRNGCGDKRCGDKDRTEKFEAAHDLLLLIGTLVMCAPFETRMNK
jgi:hypothetical protein